MKSPITTHVLDTSRGCAAEGIRVTLEKESKPSVWKKLGQDITDADGRCNKIVSPRTQLSKGTYRLTFDTARYFELNRVQSFYPYVTVSFAVRAARAHYHVPLLLSPFGYSTYRGT